MKVFGFIRQPSAAKFIMVDIMDAFRRSGCELDWLDMEAWKKSILALPLEKQNEEIRNLIERIRTFNPQFILSYGLEAFHPLFSDIIESEERPFFHHLQDFPFLCLFFDFGSPFTDPVPLERVPFIKQMQSQQFLFLCWDRDAMDVMKRRGINKSLYFPMGVNEAKFRTVHMNDKEKGNYGCKFCFVGGPTPERIRFLEVIHDKELRIYGYGEDEWRENPKLEPHYRYPVFEQDELIKIYNASFSSLNITRAHGKSSLNMRVYEAMACGSLLLTDDKEDARELFEPGQDILIYTDEQDLRERAEWILNNEESALEIARRGRERVVEEHTYYKRIQQVLPVIKQFIREFGALKEIVEGASNRQFSMVENQIRILEGNDNQILNAEWLHYINAQILFAKGKVWAGRKALDQSLEINPHFMHSLEAKKKFHRD